MQRLSMLAVLVVLGACDSGAKTPSPSPVTPTSTPTPSPTPTPSSTNDPKAALDPDTSVSGTVKFTGEKIPKRSKEQIGVPECAAQYKEDAPLLRDHVIINENKTVRNVIVWVKGGLEGRSFPPASGKTTVKQKGCHYDPHVLVVQTGQEIEVVNDDPGIVHNVHPLPKVNPAVPENKTQQPGVSTVWAMPNAETPPFYIKCDIHPWMGAWAMISPHPFYAVTGDDGSFTLKGLPPGEFVIEAWHEKWGAKTMTVKVAPKGKATVDFAFDGK